MPSYDRDLVPLYNCTTVVKLKMRITLATDVLETYTLHFWKWEKKFYDKIFLASPGFEPGSKVADIRFWDLSTESSRLNLEEESHYLLPKTGGGARPMCVSPPKRHVQSFPFPVHMKAEVKFT